MIKISIKSDGGSINDIFTMKIMGPMNVGRYKSVIIKLKQNEGLIVVNTH